MVDKLLFVFIFDSEIKDSQLILKCLHFEWIYKLDILYMKYILYSSYPMNSSAYSLSQTQSTSLQDLSQLLIHQNQDEKLRFQETAYKSCVQLNMSSQIVKFKKLSLNQSDNMVDESHEQSDQFRILENEGSKKCESETPSICDEDNEKMGRFCYRIWGKRSLMRRIPDFKTLFSQIQNKTKIRSISLEMDNILPSLYKGAIFKLQDLDQPVLYQTTLHLLKYLLDLQRKQNPQEQIPTSLVCLIPRMQVPVVMGKEGKIIDKIRKLAKTNILVDGPFQRYSYQTIQILGKKPQDVAKTCFFMYRTAWKVLKRQDIRVLRLQSSQRYVRIGIQLSKKVQELIFEPYENYLSPLSRQFNVNLSINNSLKYGNIIVYCEGRQSNVSKYLMSMLQVLDFESMLSSSIKLIISSEQSKTITSLNGKFLRDISSKSQDCYMEVITKQCWDGTSKLIIKGSSLTGRLNCVMYVVRFLANMDIIISKQKSIRPIQYEKQIQFEKNMLDDCSIQIQGQMRSKENDKSSANIVNKSKSKYYGKSKLNKYYGHITSH